MEDSMFRRLEHKPKNDEETVIGPTSPVTEKETVMVTDTPSDGPVTVPEATVDTVEEPVDPIPEPSRKPENRLSFSDEPEPRRTEPVHTPEPVPEEPHKKTAVEVVFGPNNRKKRKEEEQRALAEGRTIERPPKKSAVEVVFGPNNRKKRKEEAARLESQKTFDEETSHPEPEEGKDERRLEI